MRRWVAVVGGLVVVTAALLATPLRAAADAPAGPSWVSVVVGGSPIAAVSTAPMSLTPAFSTQTHDYVLRCAAGVNDVSFTVSAASGQMVEIGTHWGPSLSISVPLVEGQAAVLQDSTGQYWIRCLPHDFPALTVSRPGNPTPGWYLTGNNIPAGDGSYAMILDTNGTPVWYGPAPSGALDVQALSSTTVGWIPLLGPGFGTSPTGGYLLNALDGSSTQQVSVAGDPTDIHEFLQLPDGDRMMLSYALKSGVDLTSIGDGTDQTIADCVVQEQDGSGNVVWQWTGSDHIGVGESEHPTPVDVDGTTVWDIYHCNSIDDDGNGHVLLSVRHADAVLLIDRASGDTQWKLGGTSSNMDGATILSITGDPETTFSGQHDARFLPNGDISLYDDQTWLSSPARGVEYSIDTGAGTAHMSWEFTAPGGFRSPAMGSFRRYADGDSVVGWGAVAGDAFTDVDAGGAVQLDVSYPNGDEDYRAIKVPLSTFDVDTLRRTAGMNLQQQQAFSGTASPGASATPVGIATMRDAAGHTGYWAATASGEVKAFGSAPWYGDVRTLALNAPVVAIAATPDGLGYWMVAADGGVFNFGDAGYFGSMGGHHINQPVTGIAPSADGAGYWLAARDGGVFSFGDAQFHGSMGAVRLNQPVVGMAADESGGGYWMVASDGGIFSFGDAPFLGSMGAVRLNQPVTGMAARPDAPGYWLVGADGGVFSFNAPYQGGLGAIRLAAPVSGIAAYSPQGYLMVGVDGGVFAFGDAPFLGRV
jgi:Arylsulfotransferase (ASST)